MTEKLAYRAPRERVLVFPKSLFPYLEQDFDKGLLKAGKLADHYIDELFDPGSRLVYMERSEAEVSQTYIQLIPYLVVLKGNTVLTYTRTKKGGESRLHGLSSIGVGGHLSEVDGSVVASSYRAGLLRELDEEVEISPAYAFNPEGSVAALIWDRTTPVSRVHLGICHFLQLSPAYSVTLKDPALADARWILKSELKEHLGEMESWSQLIISNLF